MSGRRVELGLVPFGSIGLSLFAIDLYFAQPTANLVAVNTVGEFLQRPGSARVLFDLAMLGAFGGFYSVPLYAMIQERADRQHMSRIIAANNIINSLFMVSAAALAIGVLSFGFSIPPADSCDPTSRSRSYGEMEYVDRNLAHCRFRET